MEVAWMGKNNRGICLFTKNNLFDRALPYLVRVNLKN